MDDSVARASAVVVWSYEKNREPAEVIDGSDVYHYRQSEFVNKVLQAVEEETGKFLEANVTYGLDQVDWGSDQKRLLFRNYSSPYRVEDRNTGEEYQLEVSGHEVTVKGRDGEKTLEVY